MSDTTKIWMLMGVQMMVDEFGLLGSGQWVRYGTGIIEIGSARARGPG